MSTIAGKPAATGSGRVVVERERSEELRCVLEVLGSKLDAGATECLRHRRLDVVGELQPLVVDARRQYLQRLAEAGA